MLPLLWDQPSPKFRRGQETQAGAAAAVAPFTPSMRARVLDCIARASDSDSQGATIEEIAIACGFKVHSVCARICELRDDLGQIEDSGIRRRTTSGVKAKVWRLRE